MPSTRPGSNPIGTQPRAASPEERGIVAAHQLRAALDLFGINFASVRGDVPTTGKARVYLGICLAEDAEQLTEVLTHIGTTPNLIRDTPDGKSVTSTSGAGISRYRLWCVDLRRPPTQTA